MFSIRAQTQTQPFFTAVFSLQLSINNIKKIQAESSLDSLVLDT